MFGIAFLPSGPSTLFVADTTVANNGTGGTGGNISLVPTGSSLASVSLERVRMTSGTFGLTADGTNASTLQVSVRDSLASGTRYNGVFAITSAGGGVVNMMIKNSEASNNGGYGVRANGANARLFIGDSVVSSNAIGINSVNGATLLSYQNNQIDQNASNGTPVPAQVLH